MPGAESSETIHPSPIAMRSIEPAAGPASRSRDVKESSGAPPAAPDGRGRPRGTYPIPIALNGQP
eukprot:7253864-Pyramimonas_sp.AAC.1